MVCLGSVTVSGFKSEDDLSAGKIINGDSLAAVGVDP